MGTACLLVGSAFLMLGVANPPQASTLGIVAGLVVRVAFLLLGVAVLLLGVAALLDRRSLVGVPSCFSESRPCWAVLQHYWTDGPWSGSRCCWARSRPCYSGSRSCWTYGHLVLR
jgi:hypothetical protein